MSDHRSRTAPIEARSPRRRQTHYERILLALGEAVTSRRDILLGVGAGTAAMPVIGHAARAARNFKVESDRGSAAIMVGGAPAWKIDTRWFDGQPRLHVESHPDRLRVTLRRAFFPGTDLQADVCVDAIRRGLQWQARLELPGFGFRATVAFDRWLLGLESIRQPFGIARLGLRGLGAPTLEEIRGLADFTPDWSFIASTVSCGRFRLADQDATLAAFRLELDAVTGTAAPRTCVWTEQTGPHRARCGTEDAGCTVGVDGAHSVFAVAGRDGLELLAQGRESASSLVVHGRNPLALPARNVELAHRFEPHAHEWHARVGVDGGRWISFVDGAFQLEASQAQVLLASADASSPFAAQCAPQPAAFVVPVAGADAALFRRRKTGESCPIEQFSGHSIALDPFDLHLRRRTDGLACVVRFRNVVLEHTLRGWSLRPAHEGGAQIEFDLGSQHVREEAVYFTAWCDATAPSNGKPPVIPVPDEWAVERLRKWPQGKPFPPGITPPAADLRYIDYLQELKTKSPTAYERFRLELANPNAGGTPPSCDAGLPAPEFERAQPTHLLFDVDDGKSIPLGVDALFGWGTSKDSPLKPVFSRRAAAAGTQFIDAGLDMAISDPRSIADAPRSGPPEGNPRLEFATRIEAPAQLVVSPIPDRSGRWPRWTVSSKPGAPEDGDVASEVWNVRMRGVGLRAIYSPKAKLDDAGDLAVFTPPSPYPDKEDKFRSSYDARDLHELVALSGVYNYEALCGSPQVTCKGEPPDTAEPGKYLSMPMTADLLLLSGLGASFRYLGNWSPPAELHSRGALTVKHYQHNAFLGRDTYVRFEYKGYLFPLGQPAILVKLTDRRFGLEGKNRWVARLVQRFFIYVPRFTRAFPAVGQPHERLWGHAQTGMEAFNTPDLADPVDYQVLDNMGITAFWPCLPGGTRTDPQDVVFEFTDPLTGARYAAPLIFIDNSVAHNASKLAEVAAFWRKNVAQQLAKGPKQWPAPGRTTRFFATVSTAKLPYIAGQRGENTQLETSRVLLGVSVPGEADYNDSDDPGPLTTSLVYTSRMESRDQPPFYPVRRRALVSSTSAAVLSGQSRSQHLLEYDTVFANSGLDKGKNAATVFGVFLEPGMPLDFGQDTSRSGAAFSPSAVMVYTSVARGLLGGTTADLRKLGAPRTLALAAMGTTEERPDDFDPKKYFGQVLGDAKLLGVVKLVDVLEVLLVASGTRMPTIKRQDLYDIVLPVLRAAADAAVAAARKVEDVLQSMMKDDTAPDAIAARRLEPLWADVFRAAQATRTLLAGSTPSDADVADAVQTLAASFDKFKTELDSIAADPTVLLPGDAAALIEKGRLLLDALNELVPPTKLATALRQQIEARAVAELQTRIAALALSLAANPQVSRIAAALRTASETLQRVQEAARDPRQFVELLKPGAVKAMHDALATAQQELEGVVALASDACRSTPFVTWVQKTIGDLARNWSRLDEDVAKKVQKVADNIDSGMREVLEAPTADQRPAILRAQHLCVAILNDLNAEAAALELAAKDLRSLENIDLCDPGAAAKVIEPVRALWTYLLEAPARVTRAAAMLQEIDRDAPPLFEAFVEVWAKSELVAIEKCVAALTEAVKDAALKAALQTALDGARTIQIALKGMTNAAAARAALAALQKDAKEYERLRAYVEAVAMLSPDVIAASGRRELQRAIGQAALRLAVVREQLQDAVFRAALAAIPPNVLLSLANSADSLGNLPRYVTIELKHALTAFANAAKACTSIPPGKAAESAESLVTNANALFALLGRALASGDPSRLVDLRQVAQDLVAQLGVPTRVRIHYEWETEVHETPGGQAAIFEPDGAGTLRIVSTIEASLTGGKPSVSLEAHLSAFKINLFGKTPASNFLTIGFNGLEITAQPGQSIDCKTDLTSVMPGQALGFVQRLSSIFGGRAGFFVLPSTHGIVVGYEYSKPIEQLGGFTIQNLSLLISASLPFDNSPVLTTMALAKKEKPFLISAGIYGGGGFLSIRTRADTLEILEASFEYGVVTAFSYGPVTGSGRVTAGIYIRMGGRDPLIQGFFCAAGDATVAGLISVSAMLRVTLSYDPGNGQTSGAADFTFKFSIGLFDYSYSCTVPYAKSGDKGGSQSAAIDVDPMDGRLLALAGEGEAGHASDGPPRWAALFGRDPHSESFVPPRGLLGGGVWAEYWRVFEPAGRPAEHLWLTSWQARATGEVAPVPTSSEFERDKVSWYVVPWGFRKDARTTLRASLRITLLGDKEAISKRWPDLIWHGGTIQLVGRHGTQSPVPRRIDVGAAYRKQLEALGLTRQDALELWGAIFDKDLPIAKQPKRRKPQDKSTLLTLSAEMLAAATALAGHIFGAAIQAAAPNKPRRTAPLGPMRAKDGLAEALHTVGSIYVSAHAPRTVIPSEKIEDKTLNGWIARTLLGQGAYSAEGVAPSNRTPFSKGAIEDLQGDIVRGARFAEDLHTRFRKTLLARMASYASDLPPEGRKKTVRDQREETFEDRVAGLVAHPWLLKVLGLVIDIEVDFGLAPDELDGVYVDDWEGHAPRPCVVTHVEGGYPRESEPAKAGDDAEARPLPVRRGLVDLSARTNRFVLGQLDVDRTPQRILQTAVSFRNEFLAGVHESDVSVSLQPQETVGISLHEYLVPEPQFQADTEEHHLYLRHLLLGIRPDVQRATAEIDAAGARLEPWTSLAARRIKRIVLDGRDVTHRFRGLLHLVDEGFIGKRLRKTDEDTSAIPESEWFRWEVWPLGAPRPDSGGAQKAELPKQLEGTEPPHRKSRLTVEYECLPGATAQRIGEGYRVGARAVMVDGNSISLDEADARIASPGVRDGSRGDDVKGDPNDEFDWLAFLRFEPVQPPKILLEGWPRPSVLLPQRSARAVVTSAGATVTKRVFVPPRCANVELAIRHGMFDANRGIDGPPAGAFPGVLLNPAGDFPSFRFAYEGIPDRAGTHESYFRRVNDAPTPQVPYYPDPWARYLILGFYRAGDDQLMYIDFHDYYEGRRWPDARELELVVEAVDDVVDPRGFQVRHEGQRITVRLARGTHLKLRLWHEVSHAQLDQSGIVDQIVQFASDRKAGAELRAAIGCTATESSEVRHDVLKVLSNWFTLRDVQDETARPADEALRKLNLASFWMINPANEVELLHACEQPRIAAHLSIADPVPPAHGAALAPAPVSKLEKAARVVREEAKTSVTFAGDVVVDRPSTRHVDAHATWKDNATKSASSAHGAIIRVEARQGLLFQLRDIAEVAMGRSGQPPDSPMAPELSAHQRVQGLECEVPASVRNPKPRPVAAPYDFGDTRARVLEVRLASVSRHAAEFRDDASQPGRHAVQSRPQRLVVPAAKRPEAPKVEYVMPLYSWKNARSDGGRRRTREAGWFRVWLDDEWYTSGNGELLALVCWPDHLLDPQDRRLRLAIGRPPGFRNEMPPKWLEPLVTRWGLDPLAEQDVSFGNLPASALRNRLRSLQQLRSLASPGDAAFANDLHHLADIATFEPQCDLVHVPDTAAPLGTEPEKSRVALALYRPMFDAASGRWYADLQVDPAYAYQPFVRLALARWQPHAIHTDNVDLRLSRVVTTEFVQLLPERSATLVPLARTAKGRTIRLSVTGTFLPGAANQATSDITFRLEKLHPTRAGDAWVPLLSRAATPKPGNFTDVIEVPNELGTTYSIVIEERERFHGEPQGSGRLVYFDRLSVAE